MATLYLAGGMWALLILYAIGKYLDKRSDSESWKDIFQ